MRELTKSEQQSINGGNPWAAALLSIGSAYATGEWAGGKINAYVERTYSMSTGQAAYYTFNGK